MPAVNIEEIIKSRLTAGEEEALSFREALAISSKMSKVCCTLNKIVYGYETEVSVIVATLFAHGHVLIEGLPGVAKTTLAKNLARLLSAKESYKFSVDDIVTHKDMAAELKELGVSEVTYRTYNRVQCTPDMLPSDIVGTLVYDVKMGRFKPELGPIFTYILLADEINRAMPKTQSALLQAMAEYEVTIGGKYTFRLSDYYRVVEGKMSIDDAKLYFFVIATENPVEQEGTYPLPEAQRDRFYVRVYFHFPTSEEVIRKILDTYGRGIEVKEKVRAEPQFKDPNEILRIMYKIAKVYVPDEVVKYVSEIYNATNGHGKYSWVRRYVQVGLSPRAAIYLIKLAQAWAVMQGWNEVDVEDIDDLLFYVMNHRIMINRRGMYEDEEFTKTLPDRVAKALKVEHVEHIDREALPRYLEEYCYIDYIKDKILESVREAVLKR